MDVSAAVIQQAADAEGTSWPGADVWLEQMMSPQFVAAAAAAGFQVLDASPAAVTCFSEGGS